MSLRSLCEFALVVALAQILSWLLARALSCRLPGRIALVGAAAPLAILLPLLAGGRLIAPTDATILNNLPDAPQVRDPDLAYGVFNDAILQLLPWEAEVRRGFAEGHLPLWSDLLDGGSSPWVNAQAAVLSPIALCARLLPLHHFIAGTLAVKMLLALEGLYLLARALGASRWSATLAACAFALGGPIVAWPVFPLSSVVAWSPWLLLAVLKLVRRPAARHALAAALVVAAVLLSGHPEIALAECVLAAGFGLAIVPRGRRPGRWRAGLGTTAAAALLGAGLAAAVLVPAGLATLRSLRAVRAVQQDMPPPAGAPLMIDAGRRRLFLSALNPWAFGRPFREPFQGPGNWPIAAGGYLGLAALAGLAASLSVRRRRRLVVALWLLAAGLLLLTVGFFPLRALLRLLPLGGALAYDRFLPAAALPLALSAALGMDALMRRRTAAGSAVAAAAVAVAAAASLAVRCAPFIVALWAGVALALALGQVRRWLGFACLALVTALDLGSWDRAALPRGHRELFYPRTPLIAAIAGAAGPRAEWRAAAGGFALYPSLLPMYGIAEARIDNPLALAETLAPLAAAFDFRPEEKHYKSAFQHLDHPLLDFLNVRAVVLDGATPPPDRCRPLPGPPGPLRVYLNVAALPRFFLPTGAIVRRRATAPAAIRTLQDPRTVILLGDELHGWQPPVRAWEPAAVVVQAARRGHYELRVAAGGDRLLATSLPFPAGWTARAAGHPLRRLTVNTAYFGAIVPPGAARVDLDFAPPGLRTGMVLSLASAAVLFLLAAAAHAASARPAARRRGRNRDRGRGQSSGIRAVASISTLALGSSRAAATTSDMGG